MFSCILAATDGSDAAHRAVRAACALSERLGADLHIVHVAPVAQATIVAHPGADVVPIDDGKLLEAGEAILQEAVSVADAAGVRVASASVRQGPPASLIDEEAARIGADLIVTGRQGKSALERVVLGSVSRRVSNEADCACLTIR